MIKGIEVKMQRLASVSLLDNGNGKHKHDYGNGKQRMTGVVMLGVKSRTTFFS